MRKPPFHRSVQNSLRGLAHMLKYERNFKLELLALAVNIILIFYLELSAADAVIILLVSSGVLCTEILNTAVEKICDLVQPEYDLRVKIIKDIAAGAVVLMAACAVVTGALVYFKYLSDLF